MARKNAHIGSSFDSWLEEEGIREEVTAAAIKRVIARQLVSEMKKKKITKQRMAALMKTSRAQVDRLLDPDNGSATIESLQRAARTGGPTPHIAALMQAQGISKTELARSMKTSRAQLDRLLDPENESVTLGTLTRAAQAVGRNLRMELV